jgi:mRNA interferase RelE/StbE
VAYRLLYLPRVRKDLRKLDPGLRSTVRKALEQIVADPDIGKPLHYSLKGYHSFRTSSYRIIYRIRRKEIQVLVVMIGHRREVYQALRDLLGK